MYSKRMCGVSRTQKYFSFGVLRTTLTETGRLTKTNAQHCLQNTSISAVTPAATNGGICTLDIKRTSSQNRSTNRTECSAEASKKNAEKLVAQLKAAGFDAIIKSEDGQYKVQCGAFDVRANAEKLVKRLKAAGFDAIIKS